MTTFDRIEHGQLSYDSVLTWADSLRYRGEDDLFDKLQSGAKIPLNQVRSTAKSSGSIPGTAR